MTDDRTPGDVPRSRTQQCPVCEKKFEREGSANCPKCKVPLVTPWTTTSGV